MDSLYSPASRAERLIAAGRVVLAASSLFAVWLDPTEPAKFAPVAYSLLAAYLVYAVGLALWVARAAVLPGANRLLSHAFDLVFFSLFTYFTSGPASPFIAYFVFSLVCATLRWQWRGTFWTALVALATFLGLGVYYAEILRDPSFELTPFIIRAVYLAVYAVLLGYLGMHEERTRREMAMLAAWPAPAPAGTEDLARDLLAATSRIFGAPRIWAAWSDSEEPWLYIAAWSEAEFSWTRESPGVLEPLVEPSLATASFLCHDPAHQPALALKREAGVLTRWRGPLYSPAVAGRLGSGPLLSVPLAGETLSGRLFVMGKAGLTSDDLVLGEIVAGIVAARLDHLSLIERLREAAAATERVRLARDLHDGVLQSFTGIGLQLAATRRMAGDEGGGVGERLGELQHLLAAEQRDLRFFIHELGLPVVDGDGEPAPLRDHLEDLAVRIEQTWNVRVELQVGDLSAPLPQQLSREIYNMVREAVINAARHGAASNVRVELRDRGECLTICVADDGRGFPFTGRFEPDELRRRDIGPRTLRARLAALGGELSLESHSTGARLEIVLPRRGAA